ncbi:protein kinase domain-containing protein [Archangium violaceum]|uniref:protein kinase domain-containing protein n=1 Tax=Archangium violaceum TaxID=83451 RepID=UPI0036D78F9F
MKNSSGGEFAHWKRVSELRPGDLLIHYYVKRIRALGRVTASAFVTLKDEWQTAVEYFSLKEPITLDEIMADSLRAIQPASGPITIKRSIKQGYLWDFNVEGLAFLRNFSREQWPPWAEVPARDQRAQQVIKGLFGTAEHGLAPFDNLATGSTAPPALTPQYPDDQTRHWVRLLEGAKERKRRLQASGTSTSQVDQEILSLRRQLREGGQLRAGGWLGHGDRYLLIEAIGRGGFGTIWKALDRQSQAIVAIKVLHTNLAGDPERRERFFRGARRMAELQHPAVVRVLEQHGEDGGFHYFVMDYVAGGNLREAVLQQAVTPDKIVPIVVRVGEALALGHSLGIIHRDVKPANILMADQATPLLTDFDLVGAADTTGGTRTGALGTLVYAAPECLDRPQDADARADVYGLGMTAIFGFHGDELPFHQWMRNHEGFLNQLSCPQPIKNVLRRATSLERGFRYKDAGEFVSELKRAQSAPILEEVLHKTQSIAFSKGVAEISYSLAEGPPKLDVGGSQPSSRAPTASGAPPTSWQDPAFEHLRRAFNSGDLTLFVGAGISSAAGLPSWKTLVEMVVAAVKSRGADPTRLKEIEDLLTRGQYIDALTAAKEALGSQVQFCNLVEQQLDDTQRKVPDVGDAIAELSPSLRAILTTNLDRLLERALQGKWPVLVRPPGDLAQQRRYILHLHGVLRERDSWVMTRDDYDRAMYANPQLQGTFSTLFNAYPLLFLGFGLADDNFDAVFARVRALAGKQPPQHFALVASETVSPSRRKRLEDSGLNLIVYANPDGKHSEVARVLRQLARGESFGGAAGMP